MRIRSVLRATAYPVIALGIVGLAAPSMLGAHVGVFHNVVHVGAGALALWFARQADIAAARSFGVLLGVSYALVGAAGLLLGMPGTQLDLAGPADPRLLRLIPGALELGTADHVVHLLAGLACFYTGMRTRPDLVTGAAPSVSVKRTRQPESLTR